MVNRKCGFHSGVMTCQDAKIRGDLYVQDDIVFSDVSAGALAVTGSIRCDVAPVTYTSPTIGIGAYGSPVTDTATTDNIAFNVSMTTATNKGSSDTSCMAAFISIANTANTANNKQQGILVSNTVGGNVFDAYAVQGHLGVTANMGTANANAHITGISGKVNVATSKTVATGWVTGGLFIVEGAGAVTQMCSVVSLVQEAGCSCAQEMLYINNDGTATVGIKFVGNFTTAISIPACTTGILMTGAMTQIFNFTGVTTAIAEDNKAYDTKAGSIKILMPSGGAAYINVYDGSAS